jgi:hypothetical protein
METVVTIALVLAAFNLIATGALIMFCFEVLLPRDDRYTELAKRVDEQDKLLDLCGEANKQLFRYVERLDDVTGGSGHHVLIPSLRSASPRGFNDASH